MTETLTEMQQAMAALLGWTHVDGSSRHWDCLHGVPPGETIDPNRSINFYPVPAWGIDPSVTMALVVEVLALLPTKNYSNDFIIRGHTSGAYCILMWGDREECEESEIYTDRTQWPLHALQACYRAAVAAGLIEKEEGA